MGVLGLVHAIVGTEIVFNFKIGIQIAILIEWSWWVFKGIFIRFEHTGEVCAGKFYDPNALDVEPNVYMWKSGRFMNIYCIIGAVLIAAYCLIACLIKIALRKMRDEQEQYE